LFLFSKNVAGPGRSQASSSHNILLASQTTTPRISPPGSPPIVSASVSPRTSKPASPRRHAVSLQIDRTSSMFSSTGSMSSSGTGFCMLPQ